MSRTSRSVPALALATLLAGFALTGCADAKAGAAAVIDGDRIEISTLNSRVDQASDARESVGAEVPSGIKATQEELWFLVNGKVLDEAARRAGIVVTGTDIVNQQNAWIRQNPGASLETALATYGIPASEVDEFTRRSVLTERLIEANGGDPTTQSGQDLGSTLVNTTAESMKITINPRYGTWDAKAGRLAPTTYGWLTPDTSV